MLAAERRERDLAILARYHTKVSAPSYTWRKRGNPASVIDAVARLRNGKDCVKCGVGSGTQLHHVNENWRDYRLENLQFYCHRCHMAAHHGHLSTGAIIMNLTKTKTDAQIQELRAEVCRVLEKKNCSKTQAYRQLSAQQGKWWSGLSWSTIQTYNVPGGRERKRTQAAVAYQRKLVAAGKTPRSRTTTSTTNGNVTLAEVLKIVQTLRSQGIPVEI